MSNYGTSDRNHYFLGSHAIYNNSTSYSAPRLQAQLRQMLITAGVCHGLT